MIEIKDLQDYLNESIEVTVHNAKGTTSDPNDYGYASWREYWEDHGHDRNDSSMCPINIKFEEGTNKLEKKYRCPKCGRWYHWDKDTSDCFDGCHVKIKGDKSRKLYITPLCHGCNHEKGDIVVPRRMLEVAPPIKS